MQALDAPNWKVLILRVPSYFVVFMPLFVYLMSWLVMAFCLAIVVLVDQQNVVLGEPNLKSAEFHLDRIVDGLSRPTGLTFLGQNDILVIEEDTGKVKRVVDGGFPETILDLDVSTDDSRGLIGIDSFQNGSKTFVFLYCTESSSPRDDEGDPLGNRLYRYELSDDRNSLINPKLLLDLPSGPGSMDNGGPVLVGPDNYVYLVVGQIQEEDGKGHQTKAQNFEEGLNADGSSGVHRVTLDGEIVATGISDPAAEKSGYFAYGIRNSFGMDFDPITGKLWLSENGVHTNDEINMIESGFNGGWKDVTGFAPSGFDYEGLVSFNGTGKYSDPKFVWNQTVAPTALLFFNSDTLGPGYKNDIFVGDYAFGRIYHFELNSERTGLNLNGTLADKVANSDSELQSTIFGEEFGVPTDLEIGPDGLLYVTSLRDGAVYKISK